MVGKERSREMNTRLIVGVKKEEVSVPVIEWIQKECRQGNFLTRGVASSCSCSHTVLDIS